MQLSSSRPSTLTVRCEIRIGQLFHAALKKIAHLRSITPSSGRNGDFQFHRDPLRKRPLAFAWRSQIRIECHPYSVWDRSLQAPVKSTPDDGPRLSTLDLNKECVEEIVIQVNVEEPIEVSCYQHHGHFSQP